MFDLMRLTLQVGVPLKQMEIRHRKGPFDWEFANIQRLGMELGAKGDALQFRSPNQKGVAADLMAGLIDAIAVLSFQPGGVEFLGKRWDASR